MPCDDVTERLVLTLDAGDRVESFQLAKDTCGAPVGSGGLLPYIIGTDAQLLLDRQPEELVPGFDANRRLDQFLINKELFALQEALAVYTGQASGAAEEIFAVQSIEHGPAQTVISGFVKVDVLAEKVKACAKCCGAS